MTLTYTPFTQANYDFSCRAHLRAQTDIYPALFGARREQLDFEIEDEFEAQQQDFEDAIDRTVKVQVALLHERLTFTVQERFRRLKFERYRDVTITEWNHNSNLPSELYKIRAMLFLYGYYDERIDRFTEAIAFHVSPLLTQISRGEIRFERGRNPKNQTFICVKFDELIRRGITAFHRDWEAIA